MPGSDRPVANSEDRPTDSESDELLEPVEPAESDDAVGSEEPVESTEPVGSTEPVESDHAGEEAVPDVGEEEPLIPTRKVAIIAIGLLTLYVAVNFLDVWFAARGDYDGVAPAAVVLGAAQYNGEPSEALQGRLDKAATIYLDDRVRLVVVTGGGQADDITTEAKTGYDYLRDTASIPDEDLRLEVDGTSTYESLAAVSRFLVAEGITEVILVTDPYHARRSKLIADEVGLEAQVSPTDASATFGRLARETGAVAVGRIIGFRRINAYVDI